MKLYTEEQVKKFLKKRTFLREDYIDAMCDTLTPIELPSDKEIENEAINCVWGIKPFELGAKWIKEQIKQQEDGRE